MAEFNDVSKEQRFKEFMKRLSVAEAANSFEEGYELVCTVLNAVEDEMTTITHNPENFINDGRMYPPQSDSMRSVPNHPLVKRYRSRSHNTFIAENGAIEIQTISNQTVEISKVGSNGKGVWE